jgi:hypothetical protein
VFRRAPCRASRSSIPSGCRSEGVLQAGGGATAPEVIWGASTSNASLSSLLEASMRCSIRTMTRVADRGACEEGACTGDDDDSAVAAAAAGEPALAPSTDGGRARRATSRGRRGRSADRRREPGRREGRGPRVTALLMHFRYAAPRSPSASARATREPMSCTHTQRGHRRAQSLEGGKAADNWP